MYSRCTESAMEGRMLPLITLSHIHTLDCNRLYSGVCIFHEEERAGACIYVGIVMGIKTLLSYHISHSVCDYRWGKVDTLRCGPTCMSYHWPERFTSGCSKVRIDRSQVVWVCHMLISEEDPSPAPKGDFRCLHRWLDRKN